MTYTHASPQCPFQKDSHRYLICPNGILPYRFPFLNGMWTQALFRVFRSTSLLYTLSYPSYVGNIFVDVVSWMKKFWLKHFHRDSGHLCLTVDNWWRHSDPGKTIVREITWHIGFFVLHVLPIKSRHPFSPDFLRKIRSKFILPFDHFPKIEYFTTSMLWFLLFYCRISTCKMRKDAW